MDNNTPSSSPAFSGDPLRPTRPEPNIFCIQDYPGNRFGVNVRIPVEWHPDFKEYQYVDCSLTALESWFKKFPHLFVFHDSIFPPAPPAGKMYREVKASERLPDHEKIKMATICPITERWELYMFLKYVQDFEITDRKSFRWNLWDGHHGWTLKITRELLDKIVWLEEIPQPSDVPNNENK